jgi:sugar/nucleoside kinase (ribokinase family)
MIEAIVAGHICLDIIPRFTTDAGTELSAYLSPGRLSEVGPVALSTGGAVSNTGLNLRRLGIDTRLMGKTGDDLFGRAILDIVRGYGVELAEGMIVVPNETSSYTVVVNPPHIDRIFLHCAGANHTFGADDVRYDVLAGARLFHLGYPPLLGRMYANGGQQMIEIFRRAKETGVTTSLDMTMPDPAGPSGQVNWKAIMERCMPYVDLFLPSVEEWLFMADRSRFDELSASVGAVGMLEALGVDEIRALGQAALDMGAKIVVLKLGERGIHMRTIDDLGGMGRGAPADPPAWQNRELWAPCFVPDELVGTTGAGDATIAGFLAALLRGASPERALIIAAAVGACNVEAADALSGVRPWDETLARIEAGWKQAPMRASLPGWHVDEVGVWYNA